MRLIYAGIDEAGYGPMLGPLCVAASVFAVEGWDEGDPAPDLWDRMEGAVARAVRGSGERVVVADSKKLKLSNSLKTKSPLTHLERGVLALCPGDEPEDDVALLDAFGASYPDEAWYEGEAFEMPTAWDRARLRIAANSARLEMRRAGVRTLGVALRMVGERDFNAGLREHGGKAGVVGVQVSSLLREIVERFAGEGDAVRIVCDRQSGRTNYLDLVRAGLGDGARETDRTPSSSRYDRDGIGVLFTPGAEDRHLPVALASMAAKYTRELAMRRFNRWWAARAVEAGEGSGGGGIELKPTAGYVQDASRWLEDARPWIREEDRAGLVRLA